MALGVVTCRLPGRVERDGVGCRAHCRAVPDAARARVLVALLRAHRTLTMRQPSALAATTATRGRLARRRWRGRGGLLWEAAELATSAGPHGRTAASLPLGPARLSSSPRVRSAARRPESRPQEARVGERCGATRPALPTCWGGLQDPLMLQTVLRCEALRMVPS